MRSLQLEYTVSVWNPHPCKILSLGRFLTEECNNWIVWENFIWMICLRSFNEHECHNLSSVIYVNWSQSCAPYPLFTLSTVLALITVSLDTCHFSDRNSCNAPHTWSTLPYSVASSSMLDSFTGNVQCIIAVSNKFIITS